jgi:hypothetical protein
MKKFNWLMMLVMACVLSFTACKEPAPEPGPQQPTPEGLTFDVQVGEVTSSSIDFVVIPSDLEAEYLCVLYNAEIVEDFTLDKYLVATLYQDLEAEAREMGMTFEEYVAELTDKGILEDTYSPLSPATDYYLIVFGVDANNGYEANTEVSKTKVSTLEIVKVDVTFDVQTTVDENTAYFNVKPSDNEVYWYFNTLPTSTYQAYTDPEGAYRMTDDDLILYSLQMQIQSLQQAGYGSDKIMAALFHKGELKLEAKGLVAYTDYTNIVAAFDITSDGLVNLISDVQKFTYKTGAAKRSDMTFEITVSDIEPMRAAIKVVPSNNKETFCWLCLPWDGKQTAEEVMNDVVKSYGGPMNGGAMLYSGVQDYTGGPGSPYKMSLSSPDTDYYVIAFGYAGGITTDPVMKTFRTLPAPDATETEFTMTAKSISPYDFKFVISASHGTTYYIPGVCLQSEWNETKVVEEINAALLEGWEAWKSMNGDNLGNYLSNSCYRGDYELTASGLEPELEFMGYVLAIDYKTCKVAKVHAFEHLATTKPQGSVEPTVELVGYYSGKEENGTIFGDAEYTAKSAIIVVKYGNLDGARSLFAAMLGDNLTNLNNYSHSQLWTDASQYWDAVTIAQPYAFYVADWDYEQTALAYCVDKQGNPGGIGRLYTCPTAENKGDIEELRKLVNELNAAQKSHFSVPASIVVNENGGLTLSAVKISSEVNVAEAAEAVVTETAKETPAVVRTEVKALGNYIRPFYI